MRRVSRRKFTVKHDALLLPIRLRMAHHRLMDENGEREGRVITRVPVDSFDHRLMLARSHAGRLSIQEAAARCGFTHQSWSNWERGRVPRDKVEVAEAIAEGLGVDRDWLLHGGPLERPPTRRGVRLPYRRLMNSRPAVRRPRRIDRRDRVPA